MYSNPGGLDAIWFDVRFTLADGTTAQLSTENPAAWGMFGVWDRLRFNQYILFVQSRSQEESDRLLKNFVSYAARTLGEKAKLITEARLIERVVAIPSLSNSEKLNRPEEIIRSFKAEELKL